MKAQRIQTAPQTRCAIYCRVSSDERLGMDFNSLDAQREAAEAYIKSQQSEGWVCLSNQYSDGGFTGGNMDRPALKRLMADIEAGLIDAVCVYKVDRISRSLLDFAKMMETFETHRVSFVSVTQQFNTASSMGRLMLNVLLSFAQFEREIVSERTRDKIAAARRKGKWSGGKPILGYDVVGTKLVVNEDEAIRVRAIFQLYLDYQGLLPVVQELEKRQWVNKLWVSRNGDELGGKPFCRTSLHKLLTNVAYAGQVKHKQSTYAGEHAPVVDPDTWQRVQAVLHRNGQTGGRSVRNKFGALLKGILRCVPCSCAMTPSHATKDRTKRYRYYICSNANKRGRAKCPASSISAPEIERFVVERIKCIGKDPALIQATVAEAYAQGRARVVELEAERRVLERDLARWHDQVRKVATVGHPGDDRANGVARLADLHEQIRDAERRLAEIQDQIASENRQMVSGREVAAALAEFDTLWESLTPREQVRVVQLLVERVDYDGANGKIAITFHPTALKSLSNEMSSPQKELIA